MPKNQFRVKERTKTEKILRLVHKYAYLETLILIIAYLGIGYIVDPNDICLLDKKAPFLLMLLAVITLFHGFESGVLAMTLISFVMVYFYEEFPYAQFLIILLMTLLFSEFHYYWTQKIKKAEVDANYKNTKLAELSRAFYSLKISHDQLEKNYVVKPMSIRNALNHILQTARNIQKDDAIHDKMEENYKEFLNLVQKSFNVISGLIVFKKGSLQQPFNKNTTDIVYGEYTDRVTKNDIFNNFIVDKAIARKIPVYISDDEGEPTLENKLESRFIAAIPALFNDEIVSVLVIENMPFMAFERENLTSIAILLEYFTIETQKTLHYADKLHAITFIPDVEFKLEIARLYTLYEKFRVNSVFLVLKIDDELQSIRLFETIKQMLRSLDMVTKIDKENSFFITLLFPLHDKAAALGFLNRLNRQIKEEDRAFDYMLFDLSRLDLLNKYINEAAKKEISTNV